MRTSQLLPLDPAARPLVEELRKTLRQVSKDEALAKDGMRPFHMSVFYGEWFDDNSVYNTGNLLSIEDSTVTTNDLIELVRDPYACEAAGCLAGWACALKAGEYPEEYVWGNLALEGAKLLHMDAMTADYVFQGHWAYYENDDENFVDLDDITVDHALLYLDRVLATDSWHVNVRLDEAES